MARTRRRTPNVGAPDTTLRLFRSERSVMNAVAVGRSRLPMRQVGTSFVSGSNATKVH